MRIQNRTQLVSKSAVVRKGRVRPSYPTDQQFRVQLKPRGKPIPLTSNDLLVWDRGEKGVILLSVCSGKKVVSVITAMNALQRTLPSRLACRYVLLARRHAAKR